MKLKSSMLYIRVFSKVKVFEGVGVGVFVGVGVGVAVVEFATTRIFGVPASTRIFVFFNKYFI
jgi:hypothetical protein